MLQNIKHFYGKHLAGSDGEIGKVKDFYFNDQSWAIRYLEADTSTWLEDRQILLSPHAFGSLDPHEEALTVNLTRKQIEESPAASTHLPVSRYFEEKYNQYYGWPNYWEGGQIWGMGPYPMVLLAPLKEANAHLKLPPTEPHLRSMKEVTSYQIETLDGTFGRIISFMVCDKSWVIKQLLLEIGPWFVGKEILISTDHVVGISYDLGKVSVNFTKSDVTQTKSHQLVKATAPSPVLK